jgi:hypothetical protein
MRVRPPTKKSPGKVGKPEDFLNVSLESPLLVSASAILEADFIIPS